MGGAKDGGQVSRHPIVLLSELGELTSSKFIIIVPLDSTKMIA
jgi:hypothetical protein